VAGLGSAVATCVFFTRGKSHSAPARATMAMICEVDTYQGGVPQRPRAASPRKNSMTNRATE